MGVSIYEKSVKRIWAEFDIFVFCSKCEVLMIYIFWVLVVILLSVLLKKRYIRGDEISDQYPCFYYATITAVAGFIVSFRGLNVGCDTQAYNWLYYCVGELDLHTIINQYKIEIGFYFFMKAIYLITHNFQTFLVICSLIYFVPITVLIKERSDNPPTSYLLFFSFGFYTIAFSGIKQIIAMGICVTAFLVASLNRWASIGMILFASLFHFSALVFLPTIFFDKIKIDVIKVIIMSGGLLLTDIFFDKTATVFNSLLIIANNGNGISEVAYETRGIKMLIFLHLLFFAGAFVLLTDDSEKRDREFEIMLLMVYSALVCFTMTRFGGSAMRLYQFYFLFVIVYIPRMIKLTKIRYFKMLLTVLCAFAAVVFCVGCVFKDADEPSRRLIPYYFCWDEQTENENY